MSEERPRLLTEDDFWHIVGEPMPEAEQAGEISARLVDRGSIEFADAWDDAFASHLDELETWDLFTIGWLSRSAATDDTFLYFRAWIVSRGKQTYELARDLPGEFGLTLDPDQKPSQRRAELLLYSATRATEQLGRRVLRPITEIHPPAMQGYEPSDYQSAFPKVAARFAHPTG